MKGIKLKRLFVCWLAGWLEVMRGELAGSGVSQPLNCKLGTNQLPGPWNNLDTHTVTTVQSDNQPSSPAAHHTQAPQQDHEREGERSTTRAQRGLKHIDKYLENV